MDDNRAEGMNEWQEWKEESLEFERGIRKYENELLLSDKYEESIIR